MRRAGMVAVLLALALGIAAFGVAQDKTAPAPPPPIEVFFSPRGGCQDAIIKEIGAAKEHVHVMAYSFTSAPIAKALLEAHKRGVKVEVVIDKNRVTEQYSEATFFVNMGIPTFADGAHQIQHNKVMVIDGKTIITGSFNFSKSAEEVNAENILVLRDAALAGKYEANYQEHRKHSEQCKLIKPEEGAATAPSTTPAAAARADDPTVYVTNSGTKYHAAGCRSLARSSIEKKLSEVKGKYGACSICRPPE